MVFFPLIKIGEKSLEAAIKKIPGAALAKINQKIGFRLLTKFGEKGVINLGKVIPVVGGVIGGGMDVASTIVIAKNSIKMFIDGEDLDNRMPTKAEMAKVKNIEVDVEGEML